MTTTIDIISLGAGVQSSTMLLMADRGEIKIDGEVIIPKYAIMSDTGNEPQKVYEWLQFLKSQVKNIEIVITSNGNIINDTLTGIEENKRFASIPFFTKLEKDGKTKHGMLWRQCTMEYKIYAIRKQIRRLLGYSDGGRVKEKIRLWMGISTDEIERIKDSNVQYINNYYPLIDYEMSRKDCLKWFASNTLPMPPRSACIICPFHSNEHWLDMKTNDPESWNFAIDFDKKIRHMPLLDSQIYLHCERKPLEEVNLVKDTQENDFTNECEGICGL